MEEKEELLCPFCGEKIDEEVIEKTEEIPTDHYEKLGQE